MATSALVLMTLLSNHSVMTNIFDLEYLKTQEKKRLLQFRKEQREHKISQMRETKALMFSYKSPKKHSVNHSKYYNYLNYNIMKEHNR